MDLTNLPNEIIIEISQHLSNIHKLHFLMTCKNFMSCGRYMKFHDKISLSKITNSLFYENFTNVYIDEPQHSCLTNSISCAFCSYHLPLNIRFLEFHNKFSDCLENRIKYRLTENGFSEYKYLTEVKFGLAFRQSIGFSLPASVKKVIFPGTYNEYVHGRLEHIEVEGKAIRSALIISGNDNPFPNNIDRFTINSTNIPDSDNGDTYINTSTKTYFVLAYGIWIFQGNLFPIPCN